MKLSQAWEQWQQVAAEMCEQARLLQLGIFCMCHRQQVAFWHRWRSKYLGIGSLEEISPMEQWVIENWRDRELSWALQLWRYSDDSNMRFHFDEADTNPLEDAFAQWRWQVQWLTHTYACKQRALQAALAFGNRNLLCAWNAFKSMIQRQDILLNATVQWCNSELALAFHAWKVVSTEQVDRKIMMSGALLSWVKSKLERFLGLWRKWVYQSALLGGVLNKWTETSAAIPPGALDADSLSLESNFAANLNSLLQVQLDNRGLSSETFKLVKDTLVSVHNSAPSEGKRLPRSDPISSFLDWHLRIDDIDITNSEDGNLHNENQVVFYHVSVWNNDGPRLRFKCSYPDIELLNRELIEQYPQAFAYDDSPQLPAKRYYSTVDPHFVSSRKVALQKYLQDIIAIPLLGEARQTCAFFNDRSIVQ